MPRDGALERRPRGARRGRVGAWSLKSGLPNRRHRPNRLLDLLVAVGESLERAVDPEVAAWTVLVALTAGEGLGFNRAFLLLAQDQELRGFLGIGPRNREEAFRLWADLSHQQIRPLDGLHQPDPAGIDVERQRHAATLAALTLSSPRDCRTWHRAFVAHANHPQPCVRRWIEVLDSRALLVIPLLSDDEPWGVVLADNFVTAAPIYMGTVEAAETLAHVLRAAIERTNLLRRLRDEEQRHLAAEHATMLLATARSLTDALVNPLSIAGGTARELAAAPPVDPAELLPRLQLIADSIARIEEHVGRLAQGLASRANGSPSHEVELGELAERVVERFRPLALKRHVRLVCYRPSRRVRVAATPEAAERCVETLVANALVACQEQRGEIQVAVSEEGDWGRLQVVDTGPPLEAELRRAPFGGSMSMRRGSSGLGLASLRALAEAMGGKVGYDETETGWVRFAVLLRRWS